MKKKLEVCIDNSNGIEACVIGKVDRIELCSSLTEGGLTPSVELMREASLLKIPVRVMIRPKRESFHYSSSEIQSMCNDIDIVRSFGFEGVVFGATKNDISRSEALFDAKRADLSSTILNLIYRSVVSYINVSAYTIFTNTIEESYKRHTTIKERIERKVDGGLSAPRELSRAAARQAEAYAKLITVRQNLSKAISEYRIYFPTSNLPTKLPPDDSSLKFRTFQESRNMMMEGNPDILRAISSLEASSFNVKKVKGESMPRLDLEVRGSQYNLSEQSDEYDVYSGLNLSYDLYNGGKRKAMNEQAQAESSAYMNNKDAIIRKVQAEMSNSLQNIKLIPDNIEAYQNAYKANKQSQFYANEQFQTSNVLLLDLLQTERDFLESSQALLEALRSSQIESYAYMKLTGELGNKFKVRIN